MCLSSRETCHERLMATLEPEGTEEEAETDQPSFKDIFGVTESPAGAKTPTTTIRAPTVRTTVTTSTH